MIGTPPTSPGFVNGPLYKAARLGTKYAAVPPNFHRLYNAVGLAGGLYLGRKLMDIMVGQKTDGTVVAHEDVPGVLKPLHGILHYEHFSDAPEDRWMKVLDHLVPAAIGAMGAVAGSNAFFSKDFVKPVEAKLADVLKDPKKITLFDAERLSLYHQSKPWSLLTGVSALFGSASGAGLMPSVGHYGADLSTLFAMRSERATAPLGRLVNANGMVPFRPTKIIKRIIDYVSNNPSASPERTEEFAHSVLKTWFRGVKQEQVEAFANIIHNERAQFIKDGKLPADAQKKVQESIEALISGAGLEKTLDKIGLDPREAAIGDQGFVSLIGRLVGDAMGLGTSKKMEELWQQTAKGMVERNAELAGKAFDVNAHKHAPDLLQKLAAGTAIGVGVAGVGLISSAKDTDVGDLANQKILDSATQPNKARNSQTSDKFATQVGNHKHILHSKKTHGFVNGKILDTAEGITDTFNVINGVNSHRLYCAVGLSAGSWLSDEFMKALTGINFHGAKVKEEDILKPFKKIYKAIPFNPHSDLPNDKWLQVARWAVPMAAGCAAIVTASHMYFHEREKKNENAKYLDEIEQKAMSAQANSWTVSTALSALFGASSGFAWLPGINYMTHLGTRYSLGSGRKVSMPAVGKAWSNNSTLFPFAPPGMIDMLIKEAVNNKGFNPELMETYAIGVLKPWFDKVTPEQIEEFTNKVYEIRDQFYKEGGVPENMKKQLEEQLKAHLKGAGLEETLAAVGLDPLQAHIANNGFSGKIAESLGAKKTIEKIKADYKAGYTQRAEKQKESQQGGIALE
jgi:hypothetical protein